MLSLKLKGYYMLNKQELETFKQELENMKLQIQSNLNSSSFEMNTLRDNQPKDEGDHANVERGHNIANMLMEKQSEKLEAIERCLKRITNGTYGICDSCEESINIERLKVKVFADYCIACREVIEKESA
jgi:DnaK suppressor protein